VSKSLFIDCWRASEPAASDVLERMTWASLRIVIEGKCATSFLDRFTSEAAEAVYLPTFPIVEWIVSNWWALLYEPCRWDRVPSEGEIWSPSQRQWIQRHCLRSAEGGLFLPYLHFHGNGRGTTIAWEADDAGAFPNMPGYFLYGGGTTLSTREVAKELGEFVTKVLGWCNGLQDERVESLRREWMAITDADDDERTFCESAGRMGLNPYEIDSWHEGLPDLLARELGDRATEFIARDFLETAEQSSACDLWRWITQTEREYKLRSGHVDELTVNRQFRKAKDQGYAMARLLRNYVGIGEADPIPDISIVTKRIGGLNLVFKEHNHIPGRGVQSAVGWGDGRKAIIAGPRPAREDSYRFLEARALYQAIVGCDRGPRLLTRTRTWDQQAARAFAAEFLAPQQALAEFIREDLNEEEREELDQELARRFKVSPKVIELQLENREMAV
jgi:hypothetical protein